MSSSFSQRFMVLFSSLLLLSSVAFAAPATHVFRRGGKQCIQHCRNPLVRKEWRTLPDNEKADYIRAVQCLGKLPPKATSMKASMSRYDDFVAVHNKQTDYIHWVGHFLHWHRYFVAEYEKALRNECGYKGAQPYWNWFIDADSEFDMPDFPIFSNTTGFGSNGEFVYVAPENNFMGLLDRTGGGCVQAGPFTADKFSVAVHTKDLQKPEPRCLQRDFCPVTFKKQMDRQVWSELAATTTFKDFTVRMEAMPGWSQLNIHGGGHFSVGGLLGNMGDAYNSPGDPVFFLHHAMIDKLWADWQGRNYNRVYDVGGPSKAWQPASPQVNLDFPIHLDEIASEVTLRDVAYTKGKQLCYVYEHYDE